MAGDGSDATVVRPARQRVLDVSALQPPEPMQRILGAVDSLEPGHYLRVLHRLEPSPLYPELEKRGFAFAVRTGKTTAYEILIWKRGAPPPEQDQPHRGLDSDDAAPPKLSLEYASAFWVPAQYFLTAPCFVVAAALVLIWAGPDAFVSRWTPAVLALTHLCSIGYLALIMVGALLQVVAVVGNTAVPGPGAVQYFVHSMVASGVALLSAAFLSGDSHWFAGAVAALGLGFGASIILAARALVSVSSSHRALRGIVLAVVALTATVVLGLYLGAGRGGYVDAPLAAVPTSVHLSLGFAGWAMLLVMSVGFIVVPMFQGTSPYASWVVRHLPRILFAALVAWVALAAGGDSELLGWSRLIAGLMVVGAAFLFAILTLHLQSRTRRRSPDVTLWYWRVGMLCLLLSAIPGGLVYASGDAVAVASGELAVGILLLVGFGVSVTTGMVYKIMPFFVWLDVSRRKPGRGSAAPSQKEIISEGSIWWQFGCQCLALVLLLSAVVWPVLVYPAGAAQAVAGLVLWFHMLRAVSVRRVFLARG
jgi:hypothetical protein